MGLAKGQTWRLRDSPKPPPQLQTDTLAPRMPTTPAQTPICSQRKLAMTVTMLATSQKMSSPRWSRHRPAASACLFWVLFRASAYLRATHSRHRRLRLAQQA